MGFRLPNLVAMVRNHNINVMILSYRGYGESEGEPSEAGLEKGLFFFEKKNKIEK